MSKARKRPLSSAALPLVALIRRELFERVRAGSHFLMRALFVTLLFGVVTIFSWDALFSDLGEGITRSPSTGRLLFQVFSFVQYGLVVLSVPLVAAGAIAEERQSRSLPILLLTDLSPVQVGIGKFLARLGVLGLVIISGIPVLFFSTILGGVEPFDVLLVFSLTVGLTALITGVTIFASAIARTPVRAALTVYALVIVYHAALFSLIWVPMHLTYVELWSVPYTLAIGLVEPLNLGPWWWPAAGSGVVGLLFAFMAGVVLRLSKQFGPAREERRADRAVTPDRVWRNPIAWREWHLRGRSLLWLLVAFFVGAVLALLIVVFGEPGDDEIQAAVITGVVIVALISSLFALAVGANAFAQEKREQTLDLLRLTHLRSSQILFGKLTAIVRIIVPFLVIAELPLIAFGLSEQRLVWAASVPVFTIFVVAFFFGAVGLFYSLVAETPMRAAFPAVGTFVYVVSPLWMLPALAFIDDGGLSIGVAIGWLVVFLPALVVVARAGVDQLAIGVSLLAIWMCGTIVSAAFGEADFAAGGLHPFALTAISAVPIVESLEHEFVVVWITGTVLLAGASVFFLWAAAVLVEHVSHSREMLADSPYLAVILSLILPGAGQLYLGRGVRGGVIMAASVLVACLLGLANIAAAVDAWYLALRIANQKHHQLKRQSRE